MRAIRPATRSRDDLRRHFDDAAQRLGSVLDPEQRPAADRLAVLGARVLAPRAQIARLSDVRARHRGRSGVYLHGPVGRGKTWLADVLLGQLPAGTALRLHAFDAARHLHRVIAEHAGRRGGIDAAITHLLGDARVLFLDELHAHDPGDAMLLSRLVRGLPERDVLLLATSNYAPTGLLPDPRHHHLVLPLVAALERTCEVLEVAGPVDHRAVGHGGARPGWSSGAWLTPGSAAQLAAVGLGAPMPQDRRQLRVGGRPLWTTAMADDVVHLHFTELCEAPTSTGDLLELADRYRTLVLAGVPALSSATEDARRRFADLVDVCWDRDVRLVVLAARGATETLDAGVTDHARTASRLSLLRHA
ncbi:cell division protein ZapE [Cellulomonas sp.]|uniref:cell division protein ZapE n=1 Tax=Cellulomonas sp. TaxID=40001 RepID=UPI002811516F|nr:cell division protein ZapE [Cellulomonas sp.]